jgi:hypothetical protein
MILNPLKWWQDDFANVKGQRDGFGAIRKETGYHIPTHIEQRQIFSKKF